MKIEAICYMPSVKFELENKIEGISKTYQIPNNESVALLQKKLEKYNNKKINKLFEELISLNPELSQIKNYKKYKIDVIMGVISQFNIDDIDYFINVRKKHILNEDILNMSNKVLDRKLDYVSELTNSYLAWVPSPKTIELIEKKLLEKKKKKKFKKADRFVIKKLNGHKL